MKRRKLNGRPSRHGKSCDCAACARSAEIKARIRAQGLAFRKGKYC